MDADDNKWCKEVIDDEGYANLARLVHLAMIVGHDVFSEFIAALLSDIIWFEQSCPSKIFGNETEKREANSGTISSQDFKKDVKSGIMFRSMLVDFVIRLHRRIVEFRDVDPNDEDSNYIEDLAIACCVLEQELHLAMTDFMKETAVERIDFNCGWKRGAIDIKRARGGESSLILTQFTLPYIRGLQQAIMNQLVDHLVYCGYVQIKQLIETDVTTVTATTAETEVKDESKAETQSVNEKKMDAVPVEVVCEMSILAEVERPKAKDLWNYVELAYKTLGKDALSNEMEWKWKELPYGPRCKLSILEYGGNNREFAEYIMGDDKSSLPQKGRRTYINQWKKYPFSVPAFLESSSVRSVESVAQAGFP